MIAYVLAPPLQPWAEQLARDPAACAQLEPQIHRAFQQLADPCAARLLAHAAARPACADAAQQKESRPVDLCARAKHARAGSACWAD